jgi:hypothetical protein
MTNKEESKPRMHSIILKEKDGGGNFIYIEADSIMPTYPYGEGKPVLMASLDDKAFFIPTEQIMWIEQNWGVKEDIKVAQGMVDKKTKIKTNDVSFS